MPDVAYRLLIDGKPAPPHVLAAIQELVVEDHAEMADMLRLKIALAVSESGDSWRVLDDDLFPRLVNLRVEATVGSSGREPLIDAYVIESRAELSNQPGASHLVVIAMDPTVLMSLDEKVKAWPNMSDSDIATAIFGEHNMTPDVEATQPSRQEIAETTIQRGTDIRFLQTLAARNGHECYVDLDAATGRLAGHFHKPRVDTEPQGVLTVNMGTSSNVVSFKARHDMLGPVEAQAAGIDAATGSDQSAQADEGDTRRMGSQAPARDRPRRVLLSQSGLHETGELQALARAVADRSQWCIRAEGEVNALSYGRVLRAKKPVLVRGAGRSFSGTYYVQKVLHIFDATGYRQRFELRRNALGLQGDESFQDRRAAAR